MKINLLDMILHLTGTNRWDGIIEDDDGNPLDGANSLDRLMLEYAKVRAGGQSDIVAASGRVTNSRADTA
jgi:hypothetical protein